MQDAILRFIISIVLAILGAIYKGFVVMKLWLWFVVTQFNVAEISIPIAIGLNLLVSYMTIDFTLTRMDKEGWETIFYQVIMVSIIPSIVLVVAYLVKSFI